MIKLKIFSSLPGYIYSPYLQENVGGAMHTRLTVKQLPRPTSGDAKILLYPVEIFYFVFSFLFRGMAEM